MGVFKKRLKQKSRRVKSKERQCSVVVQEGRKKVEVDYTVGALW